MNKFGFLFKKQKNGKWKRVGSGITSGAFAVREPGIYRTNTKTNGWWGTPSEEIVIKKDDPDRLSGPHGWGIEISPF